MNLVLSLRLLIWQNNYLQPLPNNLQLIFFSCILLCRAAKRWSYQHQRFYWMLCAVSHTLRWCYICYLEQTQIVPGTVPIETTAVTCLYDI